MLASRHAQTVVLLFGIERSAVLHSCHIYAKYLYYQRGEPRALSKSCTRSRARTWVSHSGYGFIKDASMWSKMTPSPTYCCQIVRQVLACPPKPDIDTICRLWHLPCSEFYYNELSVIADEPCDI